MVVSDKKNDTDFQEINPFKITDDSTFNFGKSAKRATVKTDRKKDRMSYHNNKFRTPKEDHFLERHTLATGVTNKSNESSTSLTLTTAMKPLKQHSKVNAGSSNDNNTEKENHNSNKKNISSKTNRTKFTTRQKDKIIIPKQILKHSSLIKSNQNFLSILKVKKESVSEFVAKKREILNLQMAINIKLDEAHKLEDKAGMKNEALQRNEQILEDDAKKFELFLKENDQKAHNAIRLYESEAKKKMEKSQQVKRLNQQLQIVQADLSKKTMSLGQCMRYKEFMDKLTPTEWFDEQYDTKKKRQMNRRRMRIEKRKEAWRKKEKERLLIARKTQLETERKKLSNRNGVVRRKREMELSSCGGSNDNLQENSLEGNEPDFEDEEQITSSDEDIPMHFEKPKQLLDIFLSLEENNLFLIQNTQEMEHSIHELCTKFESTKLTSDSTREIMEQNIHHLKSSINNEKHKVACLEERSSNVDCPNSNSNSNFNDTKNKLLSLLQEKVTQIYHQKQQLQSSNNNTTSQNNNTTALNISMITTATATNEISATNTKNNNTESATNTLFMLSEIEKEISDVLFKIEKIPIAYLRKAKKDKAKKRRECKREEQLAIQQMLREERNKKVLERSMQPPKKRTTKPVMFRSHLSVEKVKEEVYEMTQEEKDEMKFLS